jgi:hypothetical protein
MYPKFNLSRTSIVILTLVGAIVCAVAPLVVFKQRPAQVARVRAMDTTPRPNDSSATEVNGEVDGPLALRVEEARKPLKRETHKSLGEERPTTTYLINPFKLTPLSNNGATARVSDEKHPEKQRIAHTQPIYSLDEKKAPASFFDLTGSARAPSTPR